MVPVFSFHFVFSFFKNNVDYISQVHASSPSSPSPAHSATSTFEGATVEEASSPSGKSALSCQWREAAIC